LSLLKVLGELFYDVVEKQIIRACFYYGVDRLDSRTAESLGTDPVVSPAPDGMKRSGPGEKMATAAEGTAVKSGGFFKWRRSSVYTGDRFV
jgi:hypothetical protein